MQHQMQRRQMQAEDFELLSQSYFTIVFELFGVIVVIVELRQNLQYFVVVDLLAEMSLVSVKYFSRHYFKQFLIQTL